MPGKLTVSYFYSAPLPFKVQPIDDCWYFIFLVPNGRFDFAIPENEAVMITEALNLNIEQTEALTIFLNVVKES